jgi:uracil-DNA glycosylase
MNLNEIKISESWELFYNTEKSKNYFLELTNFLEKEYKTYSPDLEIFPKRENIFNALNISPLKEIKVVIIGQDPYHKKGQAHGLSFSVPQGVKVPPSLRNIHKEILSDLKINNEGKGNLLNWAQQGVFLLNTSLTVREHCPNSHSKYWKPFTKELISFISNNTSSIVFMLWGNNAKKNKELIDQNKHLILESNHPSPLSAYRGFFGCKHFSKCNDFLENKGKTGINWKL